METGFALVNLTSGESFVFQFFPNEIRTTGRANWNPQEVTVGTKPLFYANREPRLLELQEIYLDNTETDESLTEEIKRVYALMDETEGRGTPPPLLAIWGDRRERCVLQDVTAEEIYFNTDGFPTRVRFSFTLMELQPDSNEATGVRIID